MNWQSLMAETRAKEAVSQANNALFSGDPDFYSKQFAENWSEALQWGAYKSTLPDKLTFAPRSHRCSYCRSIYQANRCPSCGASRPL